MTQTWVSSYHRAGSVNTVTPVNGYTPAGFSISGSRFVNATGTPLQLKGVNNSGLETDGVQGRQPWGGNPPDWALLGAWAAPMVGTQNALITRIPLNSASFLGLTVYTPTNATTWGASINADPFGNYRAAIITAIQAARAIKCYLNFDLHWVATQLTLGGVTHPAYFLGQNGFMDVSNGFTFWGDPVLSFPVWLATQFGSPAFNAQYGYNGGAAGANWNPNFGGTSGIGDIRFELFNEPFLGTGTYSAGSADLTLLNGGTGNTYITNGGGNLTTPVTYTGYQACLNAIRANGFTNPVGYGGNGYASQLQHAATWAPNDPLGVDQIFACWHPYSQQAYPETNPYPGTGSDTGSQTSSAVQWATAIVSGTMAGVPKMPVSITEDGNATSYNGGTSATSGSPHMTYMIAWAALYGQDYIPWTFGDGDYIAANNATQTGNQILRLPGAGSSVSHWPLEGEGWVVYGYISGNAPPLITTAPALPPGVGGGAYSQQLAASGGAGAPFTWVLVSDTGSDLTLSSAGLLHGNLNTVSNTYDLVVYAYDQYGVQTAQQTFTIAVGVTAPGLVPFFRMTNQGGSGNTNTSTAQFTWTAAPAGTNAVASYNIYRGTIVPGAGAPTLVKINPSPITTLSYSDTGASNIVQNNTVAPSTGYVYAITAVDTAGNEGVQQTQVYLYWYYQGVAFQSETNFSYGGLTLNWAATPPVPPPVGSVCISNAYGAAGGFQPVANSAVSPLYGTEVGGFNFMIFDCLLGDTTHTWVELNLSRPGYGSGGGGADIQPAGGNTLNLVTNTTSSYGGPASTTGWVTLKVPLAQMRLGYTTFMGYQSGTTVTPVGAVLGVGLDAGGYITGPGVPAGTYVSTAPGSPNGPYTVNNSATVGSSSAPVPMIGIRTGLYKLNFATNTGSSTWYLNNIGFCVN